METRANYVVIGLFTLLVILGVFSFVYWFQNIGGTGERAFYRVQFDGSVSGLRTGGTVLYNGIRVGEVTGLSLNPDKPQQVVATISIDNSVAVRKNTEAGLEFQGLTGIASLSLKGGTPDSPRLVGDKNNPPLLTSTPAAAQDVTQAARDTLHRLDEFINENKDTFNAALKNIETFTAALARNSEHIDSVMKNVDTFSDTLARNSDRIDKIVEGLQNLTAGNDGKSGEINDAVKAVKRLADNTNKQVNSLAGEAHHTLGEINKTVKDFAKNPGKLLFGGGGSSSR